MSSLNWRGRITARLPSFVPSSQGLPVHYLLALLLVALATAIRLLIAPQTAGLQFVTYFPAVTLAAILGGVGPAVLAVVVSSCLANFLFFPPVNGVNLSSRALLSGMVFIADEVIVCGAIAAMQRYYRRYVTIHDELMHSRVAETLLKEKAQQSNQDLRIANNALKEAKLEAEMRANRAERAEYRLEIALCEQRVMFDTVPATIFIAHDPGSEVITGNHKACELMGSPEGANISVYAQSLPLARNFTVYKNGQLMLPEDLPVHRAARGEVVQDEEIELRFKDGGSAWLFGHATPLYDKEGAPRGALGAFVDITLLKENERALQAARHEAERANEAKSRFLAAASHDLRQPLQALNLQFGLLENMSELSGSPLLIKIEYCLFGLNELLNDLLDLGKLDSQAITPEISDFSVTSMLTNLIAIHSPGAEEKGIRMHMVACGLAARTDRVLLERVLGNLLSNAVRYTSKGGVIIGCKRRHGKVWIEVHDSGIGIPQDKIGDIFDEYRQLNNPERSRDKGSGLGLAIVKRTANLLGLEVRVSSQLERGSCFAVELPLGEAVQASLPPIRSPSHAGRKLRVALVDDDTSLCQTLVYVLDEIGHQVVAASSTEALLARLGEVAPDIMIADYRLCGEERGTDAIAAVKAAFGAHIPAILLTGDTAPDVVRKLMASEVPVLHKPVKLEVLTEFLGKMSMPPPMAHASWKPQDISPNW